MPPPFQITTHHGALEQSAVWDEHISMNLATRENYVTGPPSRYLWAPSSESLYLFEHTGPDASTMESDFHSLLQDFPAGITVHVTEEEIKQTPA